MGLPLQLQVITLVVVKLFAIAVASVVQAPAGYDISPSPTFSSAIRPIIKGPPGHVTHAERGLALSPAPPTKDPTLGSAPIKSPSTRKEQHPSHSVLPTLSVRGIVPSLPLPVASPSAKSPQNPLAIQSVMSGSMPPNSHRKQVLDSSGPVTMPIALAPKKMPQNPPTSNQPIMPEVPPSIFPVPVASPLSQLLRNSPSIPPTIPAEPPSHAPVPVASPSAKSPQNPPAIQSVMSGSMPPNSHRKQVLDSSGPVTMPIAPAPKKMPQNPPTSNQPIMPEAPPSIFPVPVASPPSQLLRNSPSIPPTIPAELPSHAPVPVASPSAKSSQNQPAIQSVMSGSMPPNSHKKQVLDSSGPVTMPIAPAPKKMPQNPPTSNQPIMPEVPPSIFPVPVASPPSQLLRNSPSIPPTIPAEPPSHAPVHVASPPSQLLRNSPSIPPTIPAEPPSHAPVHVASPPSQLLRNSPSIPSTIPAEPPSHAPVPDVKHISAPLANNNWRSAGMPVAAPREGISNHFSAVSPSPKKAPSMHKVLRHYNNTVPPLSAPKSPSSMKSHSKLAPSSLLLPPPASSQQGTIMPPAPLNRLPTPPESVLSDHAPPPVVPGIGSHSPASVPSTSLHHSAKDNIPNTAPTSLMVPPPASSQRGPIIPPAPSHPLTTRPKSSHSDHATTPMDPGSHSSPASSPSPTIPSGQTKLPFLSPRISPSGSSPRKSKLPLPPPMQALPPPPPNEDCSSLTCAEPFTNTPPGSPCGCVLPMQVGLQLSVALYTFFPLVSELAWEIAVGVFLKQSQVRIMGANAASQAPEKTIVLIDLVPLGEKFDNTTAYLTFQRFWHKQVAIKASFFGDYEVLYVRYPGLPPSPPSSINVIGGGPYAGNGNNGRTIQPLGVEVTRQQHKDGLSGSVIAIIVLSASVAVILCCAVAWVWLFKSRDGQQERTRLATLPSLAKPSGIATSMFGSGATSASLSFGSSFATYTGSAKQFSSIEMQRATDNFSSSRILGEGGFGRVYSGVLEDGTKVAIKVLKRDDLQGGREFLAEIEMLSRLHHRNLVKLIGICTEERSRCLVYELIPNGSVESHLHGIDKAATPLDWHARIKIALGAARGLAYLHEDSSPRVIHRDFKSSNILLEHDFTPKVSDFGLARTALDEDNKHISTRVMGTFGYVAPEYAMTGHLLVKSDVYSYGVVLLELLTGRKPVDMSQPPGQENLVAWARPLLTSKESLESIVDVSLGPDSPFESIAKVAAIASMCVQPEVSHRPFMGEVVQALKLVCTDSNETQELGSRNRSHEDLSFDMDVGISTNSGQLRNPLHTQSPVCDSDSRVDVEQGLSMSDFFSTSARVGRQEPESIIRRCSSSGPLRTRGGRQLWKKMRRLSGGVVSEHRAAIFRSWPGSH